MLACVLVTPARESKARAEPLTPEMSTTSSSSSDNNHNNNNNKRSPIPLVEAVAVPDDDNGLGHQGATAGEGGQGELLEVVGLARARVETRRHLGGKQQRFLGPSSGTANA